VNPAACPPCWLRLPAALRQPGLAAALLSRSRAERAAAKLTTAQIPAVLTRGRRRDMAGRTTAI